MAGSAKVIIRIDGKDTAKGTKGNVFYYDAITTKQWFTNPITISSGDTTALELAPGTYTIGWNSKNSAEKEVKAINVSANFVIEDNKETLITIDFKADYTLYMGIGAAALAAFFFFKRKSSNSDSGV